MLSIDSSVIFEGITEHKNRLMILILCAAILMLSYLILRVPMQRYFFFLQDIDSVKKKIELKQGRVLDQLILEYELKAKMISFEQSSNLDPKLASSAEWLFHYLGGCGVFHYAFSDLAKVPLGGHGWPNFSVVMEVGYSQAICVLDQFFQHSVNWRFNELNLYRENNHCKLKMKIDIDVIKKRWR